MPDLLGSSTNFQFPHFTTMRLSVLCWFFADAAGLRRHQSFAWLSRELTAALARGQCLSCSWRLVCSSVRGAASGPVCSSWSSSGFEPARAVALPPATRPRLAPASTVVALGEWFFLRWGSMPWKHPSPLCSSVGRVVRSTTRSAKRACAASVRIVASAPRRRVIVRRGARACAPGAVLGANCRLCSLPASYRSAGCTRMCGPVQLY